MPFVILIEADGGPDHNITFLRSKLAAVALFLSSNVDRLTEVRGFPRYSAYNEGEKAMGILNIAWSGCGFNFPDNLPSWFKDVLHNASSMTAVRKEINDYDDEYSKAISIKTRKLLPELEYITKIQPTNIDKKRR